MAKVLLISYDNGSHIPFFPINLAYLTHALKKSGHMVGLWLQDVHHGPDRELTRLLDNARFDVVGLGFVAGYYQYRKARGLSDAINKSKTRKDFVYVIGGHGPGAEPAWFKDQMGADTVVVGDGDQAICHIAETGQKGIIEGMVCNVDEAPLRAYPDFPLDIYRLIRWPTSERTDFCFPILSSRGCKWSCSFCYRMRKGFHVRSVESIMEEIKWLHDTIQINHFQFADELLMASAERTEEICTALQRLPFPIKWDCNGRLNFAKPGILKLMKKAGCCYVNYGIESLSQDLLNQMGKGLTVDRIHAGVEATLKAGLSPGLNLIWGFPGDSIHNLREAVAFLKRYDPCDELRTIRPVTPYPGTKLYREAIEMGLLEGPKDFYERKHVNSDLLTVNFMDISTEFAHRELYAANMELVDNYLTKRSKRQDVACRRLYVGGKTDFRGYREV